MGATAQQEVRSRILLESITQNEGGVLRPANLVLWQSSRPFGPLGGGQMDTLTKAEHNGDLRQVSSWTLIELSSSRVKNLSFHASYSAFKNVQR